MNIKEQLQQTKQLIISHLEGCSEDKAPSAMTKEAHTQLITFMKAGKCIRGSLAYIASTLLGSTDELQKKNMAVALEYFQAMILIIDDIIDGDATRRGLPTMHHALATGTKDEKKGKDLAMCIATLATFEGYALLADAPKEITVLLRDIMKETCYGEMMEINCQEYDKEKILYIYAAKTGKYTFSLPLMCAALLTNNADLNKQLEQIGYHLGILFQTRDDILELISEDAAIGKSVKSDIRNNIFSYPRYALYQHADNKQQEKINSIYGSKPREEDIVWLRTAYKQEKVQEEINQLVFQEQKAIEELTTTLPPKLQQLINGLTTYCMTRTK
jgi:geranylgeranyl diphosphate synthase type I